MRRTRIINNLKKFAKRNREGCSIALEKMAIDTLRLAKIRAPQKKSFLQGSGTYERKGDLSFIVKFGQSGPSKAYARFQEYGGDGKRVVRNYSKPGSGKRYLGGAGDEVPKNALHYIKSQTAKIRV